MTSASASPRQSDKPWTRRSRACSTSPLRMASSPRAASLETKRVDRRSLEVEDVSGPSPLHDIGRVEGAPQRRDLTLQCVDVPSRNVVAPDRVDQEIIGDHFSASQREGDEEALQP